MKKLFVVIGVLFLGLINNAYAMEIGKSYYLKTALHAVRGDEIYWVNYNDTAKTILLKAGEKVTITEIDRHIIKFDLNGKIYNFAFTEKGNSGSEEIYSKFFTTENINKKIEGYPDDIKSKIRRGIAEKGMTKEQMLLAVGCPAIVDNQKTFNLGLKEIMSSDKWIYYYNRFNRWQAVFGRDGKLISIQN
ncbi:MAG: hypothetical protein HZC12_07485 [Nitrospirae bacterium]|nr:hypothetical protein [Nitrospirota bacterium]